MNKLICFDFDDTLCYTLKPEDGMKIWKEKKNEDWPHRGWWSKPETLDLDVFDTKINPYVYQEYLQAVSDPDNYVFCATGRIEKLRTEVETVLHKLNLSFDSVYLNNGGDTFAFKCRLFTKLISELQPEEFIMYDDRFEHLVEFEKWVETIDCKITIIDVINKTTKIFN